MKPHESRFEESKETANSAISDRVRKHGGAGEQNKLTVVGQQPAVLTPLKIPPILLEGDLPTCLPNVPNQKYASGPGTSTTVSAPEASELPEAYGTGALWLAARDPHCLYARWDLTPEQHQQYTSRAPDRVLQVKVYFENRPEHPVCEIPVRPPVRHSFIHVDVAGARYVAQLGYYQPEQTWISLSVSNTVSVPTETVAEPNGVQWATFMVDPPLRASSEEIEPSMNAATAPPVPAKVVLSEPHPVRADLPTLFSKQKAGSSPQRKAGQQMLQLATVADSLERKHTIGADLEPTALPQVWTAEHDKVLAELIGWGPENLPGSVDITRGRSEVSSRPGASLPPSSPVAPELRKQHDFWFNLNAELIIYGATEPNALVTLGGRPVELRADGSFSLRFALPDGTHVVPAAAFSIEGDIRQAELQFARTTLYGDVGVQLQHPGVDKLEQV